MPQFSRRSIERLETCHEDLQDLFKAVVREFDCTIVCGHRTPEEQQEIFASGRTRPGPILTHKDGITRKSKHNHFPSLAVDVAPYYPTRPHIRWKDAERFAYLAGWVMAYARGLNIKVRWGGDWDRDTEIRDETFMDAPHFELIQ